MKRYRVAKIKRTLAGKRRTFRLRPRKKERRWTPEQLEAIDIRGGGVLVSAAAGSGKTAVLVERVIRRMTDPQQPVPADRFLVVTFTNAAAAEMRERIGGRLREMIAAEPGNDFLNRQLLLLSKARICTMDSFFASLVRENYERLEVLPNIRIADEPELASMRAGAMEAVLERRFENPNPDFLAAADYFGDQNSEALAAEVLNLYQRIRSLPYPERWMDEQEQFYAGDVLPEETGWGKSLLQRAGWALKSGAAVSEQILELMEWAENFKKGYGDAIKADFEMLQEGCRLLEKGNWEEVYQYLNACSFGRIGRAPKGADPALKEWITGMRDLSKEALAAAKSCILCSGADFAEDRKRLLPAVRGIFQLVRDFDEEFSAAKAERNAADFSDFAYLVLKLTTEPDGSPTAFAAELSKQFEEILLDEYQDTNRLQDQIFRSVSQNGTGENLFLVGDLKQSIYRFRSADPEIFAEKQRLFAQSEAFPRLLRLSKNFRSRSGVLDAVNCVFSKLMSRETGGVDYTEAEAVHAGAAYPERGVPCVQVQLLDMKESGEEESRLLAEARQTARKVAAMIREGYPVTENGRVRPCRGGDFAILLRSVRGVDELFYRALQEEGVEAHVDSAEGYFASREVSVMLSLLDVLDNPLRDISMAALMLSPVGDYTCDGLTALRLRHPGESLYSALSAEAREGDAQAAELISLLSSLRAKAAVKRIRALIQYIYDATDFVEVVSGLSASAEREANLKLLLNYAGSYEKQGNGELSGFVSYIHRLMEEEKDFEVANPPMEESNTVRILTAHRSKGLEYPIVILANCSKRFNMMDANGNICINMRAGYGMKVIRRDTFQRYETLSSAAASLQERADTVSEEMRLLYVAMTRAKETLIVNITEQNLSRKLSRLAVFAGMPSPISPYAAGQMNSWADWILTALLRHSGFRKIRDRYGLEVDPEPDAFRMEVCWCETEGGSREIPAKTPDVQDPERVQRLRELVCWEYPELLRTKIPAKMAVTDLLQKESLAEKPLLAVPAFSRENGMTPAQKGTIFHRALQFADYRAGRADPGAELDCLIQKGYLTEKEAGAISREKFAAFFRSELMERILRSERVRREYRFFAAIPTARAGYEGDGEILLQGIADCIFEEDGAGVILDYKTDAASPEELCRRYRMQLEIYREALQTVFPKGIKECIIYSVYHCKAISLPEDVE